MTPYKSPVIRPTPLCARYAPLLALLRTDALTLDEAATLNEHVVGCAWCQHEAAAYGALDVAARRGFVSVSTPPITLREVRRGAESPAANMRRTPRRSRALRFERPPLSALGALAAVLVVALLTGVIVRMHSMGGGIGSGPTPIPPTSTTVAITVSLIGTNWTLMEFVVDGVTQPLVAGREPTLRLEVGGLAGGTGGCNEYGTSYSFAGDALSVGGMRFTQMYCQGGVGGTGLMEQENAYFQALPRMARYTLEGNTLTLTSGDGRVHLTFRAS